MLKYLSFAVVLLALALTTGPSGAANNGYAIAKTTPTGKIFIAYCNGGAVRCPPLQTTSKNKLRRRAPPGHG